MTAQSLRMLTAPTISLTGGTGYVVGDRITLGTGGALTTPIVMEITGTEGDGIFNIKGAEFILTDLSIQYRQTQCPFLGCHQV